MSAGVVSADAVTEDDVTGGDAMTARQRDGVRRRPRVRAAAFVAIVAALGAGTVAGYTSADRAQAGRTAAGSHVLVWAEELGAPTAVGLAHFGLRVVAVGTGPLGVEAISLGYTDLRLPTVLQVDPGRTSGLPVEARVDCATVGRPAAPASATVLDRLGHRHSVRVVLVPDDDSFRAAMRYLACGDAAPYVPPVRVTSMNATADGSLHIVLEAPESAAPTQVLLMAGTTATWSVDVSPQQPVTVRPGTRTTVEVRLRPLGGCPALTSRLPTVVDLVRTRTVTTDAQITVRLTGWDDAAVGQAAAFAVVRACPAGSQPPTASTG